MSKASQLNEWFNMKTKKLEWYDIGFIKMSVAAFTLLVAKFWPPILSLDWWWYAIVFFVFWLLAVYKAYLTPDS